jgi:DNA-binding transcriptional LysR family regulator
MLEAVTLDQLRAFVAVADEGSFSAAARALRRVQSAVSHAIGNLEDQLGIALFDRSTRVPTLTAEGRAVLIAARRVCASIDALGKVSADLTTGVEAEVSVCVDLIFPTSALVELCREFAAAWPQVALRVHTETLTAVAARVLDGTCQLGVVGPAAATAGLERRHLTTVRLVPVAAANHPLAQALAAGAAPISSDGLADHVQIVLGERGDTPDQGVVSARTWRVLDLATKHALIGAGLGWGNLPEHLVARDLASGALVQLRLAAWGSDEHLLSLALVHARNLTLGPATRWLIERIAVLCAQAVARPEIQPGADVTRDRTAAPRRRRPRDR